MGVLGPLNVLSNNVDHTPSARKLRNVLAMLVVHVDRVVPVSALMSELWDDEPPVSGLTTLQTYILNLRKMFASITGLPASDVIRRILVTRSGGYMLMGEMAVLDVREYKRHATAGWAALGAGYDQDGVTRLTAALDLWRGPALVDVQLGRTLESKRRELEESRLVVTEYLVDAKLRLGMYREVLAELAALTSENPLHEGLQAQYMRALHLSGRRAQALEVFHRLRRNLIDELGLEPELQIQRVHQAILDSTLEGGQELRLGHKPAASLTTSAWASPRPV